MLLLRMRAAGTTCASTTVSHSLGHGNPGTDAWPHQRHLCLLLHPFTPAALPFYSLLDVVYLSLEDQGLSQAARAACDPAAVPLTAGTAAVAGAIAKSSGGVDAYMARLGQLSAVLEAVAQLLCRSYPAAVPLPSSALLLLASRLLSLDDSAMRAAAAAGSAARFAQLCWHLPALHAAALRLLTQLLATGGSQLAPLFIAAARMIADLLQGCAAAVAAITITGGSSDSSSGALVPTVAAVRCWLYATARQLLLVGGAGVVRPLAPAVLAAARSELYGRQIQQQQQHEGVGIDGDLPALDAEPVRKKARKGKQQQQAGSGGVAAGSADQLNIGELVRVMLQLLLHPVYCQAMAWHPGLQNCRGKCSGGLWRELTFCLPTHPIPFYPTLCRRRTQR